MGDKVPDKIQFFDSPAAFRTWLKKHHRTAKELIVGFHRKHTAKPSMTWEESVAEALCFGWIDGIRRSLDDDAYSIRFTPRRPKSRWSAVNVRLIAKLESEGRMTPAGRAVFEARPNPESPGYTAQKKVAELPPEMVQVFKKNKSAWKFFEAQPPGYKRNVSWWVVTAKQAETRKRRLAKLIEASAAEKRIL